MLFKFKQSRTDSHVYNKMQLRMFLVHNIVFKVFVLVALTASASSLTLKHDKKRYSGVACAI